MCLQGRGGLGNIYTFAAGNGARFGDNCAADGYTNSIYTISVGSAASNGRQSDFDEDCAGKMVVTFDSDPYMDRRHVVGAPEASVRLFVCLFVCFLSVCLISRPQPT